MTISTTSTSTSTTSTSTSTSSTSTLQKKNPILNQMLSTKNKDNPKITIK